MTVRTALALALAALLGAGCSDATPGRAPATTSGSPPVPGASAEVPVARTELAGAVLGARIVVVGGLTPDGAASDAVHLYDPGPNRWKPGPRLPLGLHHVGMATVDERVYVAGGYTNRAGQDWVVQARVFSLALGDRAWREEPALSGPGAGWSRPVCPGASSPRGTIASVECLSEGRWGRVATLRVPRHGLAVAGVGDRLHVLGGGPEPGLSVSSAHEVLVIR